MYMYYILHIYGYLIKKITLKLTCEYKAVKKSEQTGVHLKKKSILLANTHIGTQAPSHTYLRTHTHTHGYTLERDGAPRGGRKRGNDRERENIELHIRPSDLLQFRKKTKQQQGQRDEQ